MGQTNWRRARRTEASILAGSGLLVRSYILDAPAVGFLVTTRSERGFFATLTVGGLTLDMSPTTAEAAWLEAHAEVGGASDA